MRSWVGCCAVDGGAAVAAGSTGVERGAAAAGGWAGAGVGAVWAAGRLAGTGDGFAAGCSVGAGAGFAAGCSVGAGAGRLAGAGWAAAGFGAGLLTGVERDWANSTIGPASHMLDTERGGVGLLGGGSSDSSALQR